MYEGIITEDDPLNMKVSVTGVTKDSRKETLQAAYGNISPEKR